VCGSAQAPSMEQLAQLDYVEACAHETMRLKPVAPIIGLQARKDTVLGDVLLPAGSVVVNLMRSDGVNEKLLPQATTFEPERWLEGGSAGSKAASAKRVSMPFGAGPRMCPGRYLALLEMKLAMATLLGRFDIESVATASGEAAAEKLSFTMMPVGLQMRLKLREPAVA